MNLKEAKTLKAGDTLIHFDGYELVQASFVELDDHKGKCIATLDNGTWAYIEELKKK